MSQSDSMYLIEREEYCIFSNDIIAESDWSAVLGGRIRPQLTSSRLASLVAIKLPISKSARNALKHEAEVLTQLNTYPDAQQYVVGFHGFDLTNNAVLLNRMDDTLQGYVSSWEDSPDRDEILQNMFLPTSKALVAALAWLHDVARLVHADIKPSNILLRYHRESVASISTDDSNISTIRSPIIHSFVLSDFGSSRFLVDLRKPSCGNTWEYVAPESMNSAAAEAPSTTEADVWAMAISLLTMVTGRTPYQRTSWPAQFNIIKQGDPLAHESNSSTQAKNRLDSHKHLLDYIKPGLYKDPSKRIKANDWLTTLSQ